MDGIAYIMATKQNASLKHLEVVANNIANANTTGFKQDSVLFDQYLVRDVKDKTAYGTYVGSTADVTDGGLKTTMRSLDVAIKGVGFFMVMTPLGVRYTRNGNFHLNEEKKLVNGGGYPVLTSDGQEIVFEEEDNAPIIGEDGSIYFGNAKRGTLGVIEFENPRALRKFGNGLFSSDVDGQQVDKPSVMQGVLEESNVKSVEQITKLIEINREVALSTNMINDYYTSQRSMFKSVSKIGGTN